MNAPSLIPSRLSWLILGLVSAIALYVGLSLSGRWYSAMDFGAEAVAGDYDLRGKMDAPSLEGGLQWFNVDEPVTIESLKGKVVLIDFWTYCCINCMHIIPDLKKLEKKYANELVVIGVHSAKFENEQQSENIRQAILRYGIEHPVVNDADFALWSRYGAQGWPNLVVIDPEGKIVGRMAGEGHYEALDDIIGQLIEKHKDAIVRTPYPLSLEKDKKPPTVLEFPGKIMADEESGRLFISDSNHNRILITDMDGKVLDIAGAGELGRKDGAFNEARFNHPQGMTLDGSMLYVADTENHLIRRLDLGRRTVETVAGTGQQVYNRSGGPALTTGLNSPWDLTQLEAGGPVYIAMAGPHQLWVYDPAKQMVFPYAGSGRENIQDGPLMEAQLAQPSGLTHDRVNLYFADSEVSALRMVNRENNAPRVETLIGKGLFDFGDRDGDFGVARLQHVLGVAWHDGVVYVADTYNHKIKAANLSARTIETIAGTGKPGVGTEDAPQFYEPGGLSYANGKLYVADTNNHAIRVVDLKTRRVETLSIDLSDWKSKNSPREFEVFGDPPQVSFDMPVGMDGRVKVEFAFPEGYHFNPLARPMAQLLAEDGAGGKWVSETFALEPEGDVLSVPIRTGDLTKASHVKIALTFYYCRSDNQGQCRIGSLLVEGPLTDVKSDTVSVKHSVDGGKA
ncbi:MAG: redoxin domain-containing protein [bacterium]|nr:redoxin domain-containing protein [bacterium]